MEKIGAINIIEENICNEACNCGWNIKIGGKDIEDLKKIKDFLHNLYGKK